jgi:hypothetical protein
VPAPRRALAAIPGTVITRGAVRLWNDKLTGTAGGLSGTGPNPAGAPGADLAPSPVTVPDLFANHALNAQKLNQCLIQLGAIRKWDRDTYGN